MAPEDLISRARALGQLAGQLNAVAASVDAVRMDRAAYGELCQVLPAAMAPAAAAVAAATRALAGSLADTDRRLRDAAAWYRDGDARAAETYRQLGDQ